MKYHAVGRHIIGERKTWMQSEFCTWQNSVKVGGKSPKNVYSVAAQETATHRTTFG